MSQESELLIGCGNSREKKFQSKEWNNLVTLDIDPGCKPDVLWDLNEIPYPFDDEQFTEIHAYEVLEHCGAQGDWKFFFDQFTEFWRILKPGGHIFGTTPHWMGIWAWGDPGHRRIINDGTMVFLQQKQYQRQVKKNAMTDYRHYYKADFSLEFSEYNWEGKYLFALKAIKEPK